MITRADLIAGVSLATGCLLFSLDWAWKWRNEAYYNLDYPSFAAVQAALVLGILVFGLAFTVLFAGSRRSRLLAIPLVMALYVSFRSATFLYLEPHVSPRFGSMAVRTLQAGFVALVAFCILRCGFINRIRTILLITSPFTVIFLVNLWIRNTVPHLKPRPPGATAKTARGQRVVWLVFDEMDEKLAFSQRPAELDLPQFDRFRASAVNATRAVPPHLFTSVAIPSLLTGKPLNDVEAIERGDLSLIFAPDGSTARFSQTRNIFDDSRNLGAASGLVGWFHPYCRVIGSSLDECYWRPLPRPPPFMSVGDLAMKEARDSAVFLPLAGHLFRSPAPAIDRGWRAQILNDMLLKALALVADDKVRLAFIHLPIPHPPGVYDRERGRIVTAPNSNYLDNLALADRILGELRHRMEVAGVWESSAVMVMSDHPFRPFLWSREGPWSAEEERLTGGGTAPFVPWMVKLPGQRVAARIDEAFPAILTHDFVLEILKGNMVTPDGALAWVKANSNRWGTPHVPEQTSPPKDGQLADGRGTPRRPR